MILPIKYINFSQSLLNLSIYTLPLLNSPKAIDELWNTYEVNYKNNVYLAKQGTTMILPTKHINFSQSLLGLGAYILPLLNSPKTIDELWNTYKVDHKNNVYLVKHSFDNLVMTLIFLYSIGIITENNGVIKKCA